MFSAVITSYANPAGLYLTYFSLRSQLEKSGSDAEIVIVVDGGTEWKFETLPGTRVFRGYWGSPQASRDAGIKVARFNEVLVVEDHVIVSDIFKLVEEHKRLGSALTFASRRAEGPEMFDVFGCSTDWFGNLWFKELSYKKPSDEPYRVSQFGNSAFVVDRNAYMESGGYTNLLKGWGGEEPLLALKFWMLGRECWMCPSIWQAHFLTVGAHPGRTSSDEFGENMLKVAFILGGPPQLEIARKRYPQAMFHVEPEILKERKRLVTGPFKGDLEVLRKHLATIGVN